MDRASLDLGTSILSITCNQPIKDRILVMLRTVEGQHKERFTCQLEVSFKAVCLIFLEQTSLNFSRPPATCNFDYAIYTTGIRYDIYGQQRHRTGTNRSHTSNICTGAVVQVLLNIFYRVSVSVGHYRVPKALTFETRLSAKPFLFKLLGDL